MNAKCPYCDFYLMEDESYDLGIDFSEIREYVVGHCDNCGREFQWTNRYVFSGSCEILEK